MLDPEQRIAGGRVIPGKIHTHPFLQEGSLKTKLNLAGAFRRQSSVTNVLRLERHLSAPTHRVPGTNGVEGAWRPTRLTPGTAQFHPTQAAWPKGFVRDHIGSANFWVAFQSEIFSESTIAIDTQTQGQEILVLEVEQSLAEKAGVDDFLAKLARELNGRTRYGWLARRHIFAVSQHTHYIIINFLAANRQVGTKIR